MDEFGVDVAIYDMGNKIEGRLYVKHNVKDINVKLVELQCISSNEETKLSKEEPEEINDDARRVMFDDSAKVI